VCACVCFHQTEQCKRWRWSVSLSLLIAFKMIPSSLRILERAPDLLTQALCYRGFSLVWRSQDSCRLRGVPFFCRCFHREFLLIVSVVCSNELCLCIVSARWREKKGFQCGGVLGMLVWSRIPRHEIVSFFSASEMRI
jgi:hypothetical protein